MPEGVEVRELFSAARKNPGRAASKAITHPRPRRPLRRREITEKSPTQQTGPSAQRHGVHDTVGSGSLPPHRSGGHATPGFREPNAVGLLVVASVLLLVRIVVDIQCSVSNQYDCNS